LMKREAKRAGGDALGTPPLADDTPADVFDEIRKRTKDAEDARRKAFADVPSRLFTSTR
jgi:hypothetical protein